MILCCQDQGRGVTPFSAAVRGPLSGALTTPYNSTAHQDRGQSSHFRLQVPGAQPRGMSRPSRWCCTGWCTSRRDEYAGGYGSPIPQLDKQIAAFEVHFTPHAQDKLDIPTDGINEDNVNQMPRIIRPRRAHDLPEEREVSV